MTSCPHVEPCEQCKKSEESSRHFVAWLCAVLAPIAGMIAIDCALELDPRASAWTGFAIGCVFMWNFNRRSS